MAQTTLLIETLKLALKAHGRTYRDVAAALGLSEASVKRLFSNQNLSLDRLEEICHFIGMEIGDLVAMMNDRMGRTAELSESQEQQIADDEKLLLVAVCVLYKFSFNEILEQYDIEETELIQKLAHLDRLKIIELLPKNRIKLLITTNFQWRENGPIQRFFQDKVEQEFFDSNFDRSTEKLIAVNGLLCDASNEMLQRKMARLAEEFAEHHRDDERLSRDDRKGSTLVLAIRQWEFGMFEKFKRKSVTEALN